MWKIRECKNAKLIIFKDVGDKKWWNPIHKYLKGVKNEQKCLRNGVQLINKYFFKHALYKVNKKQRKY